MSKEDVCGRCILLPHDTFFLLYQSAVLVDPLRPVPFPHKFPHELGEPTVGERELFYFPGSSQTASWSPSCPRMALTVRDMRTREGPSLGNSVRSWLRT